jgi:hypothetical protein
MLAKWDGPMDDHSVKSSEAATAECRLMRRSW